MDIGTLPLKNSISDMALYMENNPRVGGLCGEIEVKFPEDKGFGANALASAQYLEYKISHYLDKQCENLFGFVSVLPGAFSMLRWDAIKGDPLQRFFMGLHREEQSAFDANMYLAEDRVMSLEILTKKGENWLLKYLHGAKALTDVPLNLSTLVKQRRRWINGSLMASLYCMTNFCRIR